MKTIFTYPNNSGTSFIDPDYVGDDTVGFQKRIKELKEQDYKNWYGNNPPSTAVSDIMAGTSKYNNAIEETSGNNTIYQFWWQPMVECTMRAKESIEVSSMSIVNDGGIPKIKVTSLDDVTGLVLGTPLYGEGFTTGEMNGFTNPNEKYAVPIDTNNFYLAENATGTEFDIDFLNQTIYNNKRNPSLNDNMVIQAKAMRRDFSGVQGSIIKSQYAWDTWQYISDTDALQNLSAYTSSNSGTLNSLNPFYNTLMTNTSYTIEAFTDAAKTTRATVEEKYVESAVKTFTATGTYDLEDITFTQLINDWGMTQSQIDNLIAVEGVGGGWGSNTAEGWCRLYAVVTSGTFVGVVDGTDTIPENAVSYEYEFYWYIGVNGELNIFDGRGAGRDYADFQITGTNPVDVDIHIKFIETGITTAGICPAYTGVTTDAGATLIDEANIDKYEIASATVILPGSQSFMHRTGASTYAFAAQFEDNAGWLPGGTSALTLGTEEIKPNADAIVLTSNGTIDSFSFVTGSGPDRGTFDTNDTRLFQFKPAADTYTPPAPTPAELADVFDTDDEWADYGYAGGQKKWPFHVTPSKADIVYNSPTIVNMSQNGVKYSRSVGHTDWRLDVAYPPMTHEEFQKFHAIAQAAQGQAMPFFFMLRDKVGNNILWRKFREDGISSTDPRAKDTVDKGDRLALIEGFQSNESNVFLQGEVFIDGNNENGYLHTVLNTIDSNVYGEAKIRTPWPFRTELTAGSNIYKNPAHAVVTLANDNFEYKVDTAGYYYVSVSFDLDDWK